MTNSELLVDSGETSLELVIRNATRIELYARNVYEAPSNTFLFVINELKTTKRTRKSMSRITLVIVVFASFLTFIVCVTLFVQLKRRHMHNNNNAEIRDN